MAQQHLDHFQTTTLAPSLPTSVTSVVETQPTLMERQASRPHSIMHECSTREYVLPLHHVLSVEAIMRYTVYAIGYRAPGAMEKVEELVRQGARVLDIRMMPRSRYSAQWNRKQLEVRFGLQNYDHLELLGNINCRFPDRPIHLQNSGEGLLWLLIYLQRRNVMVLCGCPRPIGCHRDTVCRLLRQSFPTLSIRHLIARTNSWDEQRVKEGDNGNQ